MEKLQRFSIRKLSIGAVSCLIGTVSFLSYSYKVQAAEAPQTVETAKAENEIQLEKAQESKPNEKAEGGTQSAVVDKNTVGSQETGAVTTVNQASPKENVSTANEAKQNIADLAISTKMKLQAIRLAKPVAVNKTNASSKPVQMVSLEQSADTTDVQPASDQVESAAANSNAPENNGHAASASTALPKQPANADTQSTMATSGVQPFMNLAVVSDNNDLTPKRETVDSTLTLHYVNQADHKQELKDPTVITMQYTRTNTPQSDGTTEYGDWSYVPGSFKQTGTPITVKDSDNPVKQDNVDKNGENFDVFTITAMYPTVAGYGFYNGINGTRLHDNLRNNERQADAMSKDFYAEYDVAKPTQETVGSQWRIHYIDSTNHEHELKAPTVINMQYVRTNTPQSDGTIQHGDWSYVPGSFKLTGTPITVNDSDNPVKDDNVDKDGKNMDVFIIDAMYPSITGYNFHDGINNARLHDYLLNYDPNGNIQMPTMGQDFYVEYDPISERSVAVKFVDDQSYDFNTSDHKKQVGQAITLTGHDGDTVNLNLTVPDKYQLADGQQLPTTYTFTKGSGDLKIHLVHKVVQREATVNVKLAMLTEVNIEGVDWMRGTVTQERWGQLGEKFSTVNPGSFFKVLPSVEVGTLTGHVNYDVVDNSVVSLGDNWTTLNLGGRTYQLPNGTDVVNGVLVDSDDGSLGKPLREYYLKHYSIVHPGHSVDPDYATRPWYGYLSVNETNDSNNPLAQEYSTGFQGGLAGNEPNALAKANGDQAATAVETTNKTIDVSALTTELFSEQDGQLQATLPVPVYGVYIPYVEKTATRTINVTMPDGKTTTVEQTATLAKQVDLGKDAHPAWTTGEWSSYDVPTIPGYTASQLNVAKETVTGATNDQTVNITYMANDGTQTIVYQDEDGSEISKQVVSGKTDETIKVTPDVPDGYVLKGEVPSEVTIKPDDTPITITIEHGKSHIDPDKPVNSGEHIPGTTDKTYPSGLTHDDLNKTITREVTITDPTGKKTTTTQTVTFTRGATVDEVTGGVTYDDWSENGEHTFDKVDVPTVLGYTASGDVPSLTVTPDSQSTNVTVTYNANEQTATITYIDDTEKKSLGSDKQNGKFNQVITFEHDPTEVIKGLEEKGYKLVSNDFNGNKYQADNSNNVFYVHLKHQHQDIDADHIPSGAKDKDDQHNITADDFSKKITRTIEFETPTYNSSTDFNTGTKAVHHDQSVTLQRHGDYDKVTGLVTWKAWSEGNFDAVNVGENGIPTFDGYDIDITKSVGYDKENHRIDAMHVTSDTKPSVVIIRYKAQDHTVTYHFVDENGKQQTEPDGTTPIADETVSGKTDDTVNTPKLPDGWVLDGDTLDPTVKIPTNDQTVNLKIKHGQVTVTHDNPVNNGDKIPNTTNKTYGDGLTQNDLNQQGTRTIVFNFPKTYSLDDAKKTLGNGDKYTQVTYDEARNTATIIQTIHFTRDAVVDTVTGKVVEYKGAKEFTNSKTGEKSLWDSDPASGRYAVVKIPKVSGYKSKLEHTKDEVQFTPRGFNFARYYMVNFMALPSNPGSKVPSEPAKTPGTNLGDAIHVDKPGEVGNMGQDQGNKGQDQGNKSQDQGGQKTDDHKGQTPSGNTDNTQKSDETKSSNNDQKLADNLNADNTKLDEDINSTDRKLDGKKSGNNLDTKLSSKKSAKTVVNITKKTALNGNDKGVTNMVTTASTTGTASDSVVPKDNIANAGNGKVAGVRTVQAATVNGSANVAKDLPHTGEKQGMIDSIFGALASGLGILGLAGAKHKKKED